MSIRAFDEILDKYGDLMVQQGHEAKDNNQDSGDQGKNTIVSFKGADVIWSSVGPQTTQG